MKRKTHLKGTYRNHIQVSELVTDLMSLRKPLFDSIAGGPYVSHEEDIESLVSFMITDDTVEGGSLDIAFGISSAVINIVQSGVRQESWLGRSVTHFATRNSMWAMDRPSSAATTKFCASTKNVGKLFVNSPYLFIRERDGMLKANAGFDPSGFGLNEFDLSWWCKMFLENCVDKQCEIVLKNCGEFTKAMTLACIGLSRKVCLVGTESDFASFAEFSEVDGIRVAQVIESTRKGTRTHKAHVYSKSATTYYAMVAISNICQLMGQDLAASLYSQNFFSQFTSQRVKAVYTYKMSPFDHLGMSKKLLYRDPCTAHEKDFKNLYESVDQGLVGIPTYCQLEDLAWNAINIPAYMKVIHDMCCPWPKNLSSEPDTGFIDEDGSVLVPFFEDFK